VTKRLGMRPNTQWEEKLALIIIKKGLKFLGQKVKGKEDCSSTDTKNTRGRGNSNEFMGGEISWGGIFPRGKIGEIPSKREMPPVWNEFLDLAPWERKW